MMFYVLVVLVTLVSCYMLWTKRNLPPGPWGIPLLGYLPWLDPKHPYKTLTQLAKEYGSIYGMYLGNVYTVVLTDPKVIKRLFFKDATTGRAPLYLTHGIMNGYGLICAEGDLWKEQRRFVHNCLRQLGCSKIGPQRKRMEMVIMQNVRDFVQHMEIHGDRPLDPLEPLRHSLGSTINVIVFGKTWSRYDETWKWLQHLQEEGTQHIGVAGPLNFLPLLRFVPKFTRTVNFLIDGKHKTHVVYQKIIEEQAEMLKKQNAGEIEANNIIQAFLMEREKRKDETEVIERFYNDQQFYHLLADIFGAGLDTTLTTLRWYLLYLAKHRNVQNSIRAEIREVLLGRSPSVEDMPHLPLTLASVYEVQRIRPVVPLGIPHGSLCDLEVDGYRIPRGTMLVPLQWAIHMNENVWVEPEEYNPWRFIDDEGKILITEYFMPYQMGKRMCVGDELARMLLFLFGAAIVQNFELGLEFTEPNLTGDCGITLTPKPHRLIFTKIYG